MMMMMQHEVRAGHVVTSVAWAAVDDCRTCRKVIKSQSIEKNWNSLSVESWS